MFVVPVRVEQVMLHEEFKRKEFKRIFANTNKTLQTSVAVICKITQDMMPSTEKHLGNQEHRNKIAVFQVLSLNKLRQTIFYANFEKPAIADTSVASTPCRK